MKYIQRDNRRFYDTYVKATTQKLIGVCKFDIYDNEDDAIKDYSIFISRQREDLGSANDSKNECLERNKNDHPRSWSFNFFPSTAWRIKLLQQ